VMPQFEASQNGCQLRLRFIDNPSIYQVKQVDS
jgi:hypothetical protein